ncbi:hypothetical protein ACROYT_G015448 [Oculina patagonica]
MVFDGSIERINCITEHEDYAALTNRTVLSLVGLPFQLGRIGPYNICVKPTIDVRFFGPRKYLRMSIGEQGITEDAILEFADAVDKEPSEPGYIFKLEQAIHERVEMEPSKVLMDFDTQSLLNCNRCS